MFQKNRFGGLLYTVEPFLNCNRCKEHYYTFKQWLWSLFVAQLGSIAVCVCAYVCTNAQYSCCFGHHFQTLHYTVAVWAKQFCCGGKQVLSCLHACLKIEEELVRSKCFTGCFMYMKAASESTTTQQVDHGMIGMYHSDPFLQSSSCLW